MEVTGVSPVIPDTKELPVAYRRSERRDRRRRTLSSHGTDSKYLDAELRYRLREDRYGEQLSRGAVPLRNTSRSPRQP